jgi:DNA-binding response OmpR family regulator
MTTMNPRGQDGVMTDTPDLLIVDDDRELTTMLAEYLARDGFVPTVAGNAAGALLAIHERRPDLVILDVMLPGASGLDLLRDLRRRNLQVPVLLLTAQGEEADRVIGLELGADDYVTKPFNPRELAARVRAILRRGASRAAGTEVQRVGSLELDAGLRQVRLAGEVIDVTGAEFSVLMDLMRRPGQVVSRAELTERALGRPLALYDRSIDTHVSNLRRKLDPDKVEIRNVRGAGYILMAGTSAAS